MIKYHLATLTIILFRLLAITAVAFGEGGGADRISTADKAPVRQVETQDFVAFFSFNSRPSILESPLSSSVPENFIFPASIEEYLQKDSKVHIRSIANPWFTASHTKMITIDKRKAYIGGMNIGISDPDTVNRLKHDLFEVDFAKSKEMTELIDVSLTHFISEIILDIF